MHTVRQDDCVQSRSSRRKTALEIGHHGPIEIAQSYEPLN
jgi:hypothetical protein